MRTMARSAVRDGKGNILGVRRLILVQRGERGVYGE